MIADRSAFLQHIRALMVDTPVLIVGAGPAGCSTSFFLSKAGIPHIIIDKAAFPRDKICGDGVSSKSLYVLRSANEAWLDELWNHAESVLETPGLTFIAPNGKALPVSFGTDATGHTIGFTAPRLFFDDFLFHRLDQCFATIRTEATLNNMTRSSEGWNVSLQTSEGLQEIHAGVVVAADGDKSIVRKLLALPDDPTKTSAVGLRAYYNNVAPSAVDPENIELFFLPKLLPGYFWIFPMSGGRANVGVGMLAKDVRDKKLNLREKMLDAIANNSTIRDRFKDAKLDGKILGWGLPMCEGKAPISGNRYILTGDAARLIDPFSGEGIGNALYSGMKAAQAIIQARSAGDFSEAVLKEFYDKPVYKRLWGELQTSILLQRLCKVPWLFNFVVNKAQRSPTLKSTISGMFTDIDLREKLTKPSFYLKMLFNK